MTLRTRWYLRTANWRTSSSAIFAQKGRLFAKIVIAETIWICLNCYCWDDMFVWPSKKHWCFLPRRHTLVAIITSFFALWYSSRSLIVWTPKFHRPQNFAMLNQIVPFCIRPNSLLRCEGQVLTTFPRRFGFFPVEFKVRAYDAWVLVECWTWLIKVL